MPVLARTIEEAIASIADGCVLLIPRESSGVPMAATRALIRRGAKRLHARRLPDLHAAGRPSDRSRLRRDA